MCIRCLRDAKARDAWTVSDGDALRIRHAVAHFGLDDDMEEHWLYQDLYEALRQLGYKDVY
jgi:hypothetical protein